MASEPAPNPYDTSLADRQPRPRRHPRYLIPALICIAAIVAVPLAFLLGGLAGGVIGQVRLNDTRAEHQKQRIEEFFAQHPGKFGNLAVEKASAGWAYPTGTVKTQADYDFLVRRFEEMFGDELARQMIYIVEIDGS